MNNNAQFPVRVVAQVTVPNPEYVPYVAAVGHSDSPDYIPAQAQVGSKHMLVEEECCLHGFYSEGPGDDNCVVGLVERADGSLQTVWCEKIKFVNPTKL